MASLWYRNLCICSNRCLSAAKFIGFSAISQSCRCVRAQQRVQHHLCPPSSVPRLLSIPSQPPASSRPCGIPLETFRYSYLPATTSKIPSSPRSACESSLSVIKDSQPLTISARSFPTISSSPSIHLLVSLSNMPFRSFSLLSLSLSFSLYLSSILLVRSPSSMFERPCLLRPFFALLSALAFAPRLRSPFSAFSRWSGLTR